MLGAPSDSTAAGCSERLGEDEKTSPARLGLVYGDGSEERGGVSRRFRSSSSLGFFILVLVAPLAKCDRLCVETSDAIPTTCQEMTL
jgi:hypothetical protein